MTDYYNIIICNITVTDLPISPTYCCYTTLGNINNCTGQYSALAHHACQTIKLLQRETLKLIPPDFWPPNSPDLSPVDSRICISRQFEAWPIWDSTWLTHGTACRRALWTILLTKGGRDFRPVWMKKEDILNTCYSKWSWTRTGCADKIDVGWWDWKSSLCTWLVFQGSVAAVHKWDGYIDNCYIAN